MRGKKSSWALNWQEKGCLLASRVAQTHRSRLKVYKLDRSARVSQMRELTCCGNPWHGQDRKLGLPSLFNVLPMRAESFQRTQNISPHKSEVISGFLHDLQFSTCLLNIYYVLTELAFVGSNRRIRHSSHPPVANWGNKRQRFEIVK